MPQGKCILMVLLERGHYDQEMDYRQVMKVYIVLSVLSSGDPPIFSTLLIPFKFTPLGLNVPDTMRQTEQDPF